IEGILWGSFCGFSCLFLQRPTNQNHQKINSKIQTMKRTNASFLRITWFGKANLKLKINRKQQEKSCFLFRFFFVYAPLAHFGASSPRSTERKPLCISMGSLKKKGFRNLL